MSRNIEKATIDGEEYQFYQMPAMFSTKLLWKILRYLGISVKDAVTFKNKVSDLDVDIGNIISNLFEKVDPDELENLIKDIFSQTTYKGKMLMDVYSVHFQRRHMHLTKVLYKALEVEYHDFLPGKDVINKGKELFQKNLKDTTQDQQT
jgi:hypothetical protein